MVSWTMELFRCGCEFILIAFVIFNLLYNNSACFPMSYKHAAKEKKGYYLINIGTRVEVRENLECRRNTPQYCIEKTLHFSLKTQQSGFQQ